MRKRKKYSLDLKLDEKCVLKIIIANQVTFCLFTTLACFVILYACAYKTTRRRK